MVKLGENWPVYYRDGLADHFHAVGVLVAAWQHVEDSYHALFQTMGQNDPKFALFAFDLLGNDSRAQMLGKHFPEACGIQYQEPIDHFLKCAAICKENRNAIAHSSFSSDQDPNLLLISKGLDSKRERVRQYRFSLASLREMADHTYVTAGYGLAIFAHVTIVRAAINGDTEWRKKLLAQLPSLDKPPLPRKWVLHNQEPPQGAPPPQEPSPWSPQSQ